MRRLIGIGVLAVAALALPRARAGDEGKLKGQYVAKVGGVQYFLDFDGKGKYVLTKQGTGGEPNKSHPGTYKLVKDRIDFTDKGDTQVGKYRWKLEKKNLTFT
jgi:hypothetical protein